MHGAGAVDSFDRFASAPSNDTVQALDAAFAPLQDRCVELGYATRPDGSWTDQTRPPAGTRLLTISSRAREGRPSRWRRTRNRGEAYLRQPATSA